MERFLSLFDYLGKAAGPELGKQVEAAARAVNIPVKHKQVHNTTYTGKVNMYPENWLIGYFTTGQSNYNEKKEFFI